MKFYAGREVRLWGLEKREVSAHPSAPSVVASGPFAGRRLDEVAPGFPILVKTIIAEDRLSVQVHPDERAALLTGGEPKTEMWCILEPGPIYAGLKDGVGADDVRRAVADGKFEDLLVRHDAKRFECYVIPGGLVHAIGGGVKLFEVQQSSDTTYRLYDWGRVGADGAPRRLHIAEALASIDFSLQPPRPQTAVDSPFFTFRQRDFDGEETVAAQEGEAIVVYAPETGDCELLLPGESARPARGRTFVVRAPYRA